MFDELDQEFDERTVKGRHRRGFRRKQSGKRRGGPGRGTVALLTALVLLIGLGGGAWYGFDRIQAYLFTPDYSGGGSGEVVIEVKDGDFIADIGDTLVRADVVKSSQAFIKAARSNSRSNGIQPGLYKMRKQMSGENALLLLLDLTNKVTDQITIPEGRTARQTYQVLAERTGIPVEAFESAAKDPVALGVPDSWFARSDGKKPTVSIEGFLFPDTYDFPPDATAETILKTMVQRFLSIADEIEFVDRVARDRGGITAYEALIVASLAQAEAGHPEDLGKVARVAYNRLFKPNAEVPCECFEMDVTVNYWLEVQGKATKSSGQMTESELNDPRNPYNRKLKGFVPTPIDNPGKAAMQGAMDPPDGDWYFFVAIDPGTGKSAFAETNAKHEANKVQACRNGVPLSC